MDESALSTVLELERELQSPATRADTDRLLELLAPDFLEVGASGRLWDRDSILGMLQEESADEEATAIEVIDLHGRVLAPGVIQVVWESRSGGRRARRTSTWCERGHRWQQVHHQGTPLAGEVGGP